MRGGLTEGTSLGLVTEGIDDFGGWSDERDTGLLNLFGECSVFREETVSTGKKQNISALLQNKQIVLNRLD